MSRHRIRVVAAVMIVVLIAGANSYSSVVASASGQFHTVTFNENDSLADGVYAGQTADTSTDLTLFSNLNPSFSNPGMTFVSWSTAPDGSGITYTDGESYGFGAPLTLYAIWVGPYVTVTFNENDSSSDSTIAAQTQNASSSLTLFSNLTPSFKNVGYTFVDWNTEEGGGGTSYSNGAAYNFESPLALYAQWTALPAVIATFSDNEGVGTIAPISEPSGSTITLPSSESLTRTDFLLSGWNTAINGSGTEYAPGASAVLNASGTYYAQWTETSPLEILILDNGGTGSEPTLSGEAGTTVTLPGVTGLTNTGYTLTSWNTAANGSGTSYTLGQDLTLTSPLSLYAQWTATPSSIKVNFNANGGSGSLVALSGEAGSSVTLPSAASVVRSGYKLASWNTTANGSGTSYSLGQSLNLTSTLTLYAQWEKVPTSVLYGDVGVFGARSAALTASLKKQVRNLATTIKTRKYTKVALFGFTAATGRTSLDKTLSSERANNVANYLRDELRAIEMTGVTISVSGQGSVEGKTSSTYSRVEVFVS